MNHKHPAHNSTDNKLFYITIHNNVVIRNVRLVLIFLLKYVAASLRDSHIFTILRGCDDCWYFHGNVYSGYKDMSEESKHVQNITLKIGTFSRFIVKHLC